MARGKSGSYDVVVLGGGWAGLLAAREIRTRRPEWSVLVMERDARADSGGLLRSAVVDGFTFDCGGPHILFSKHPETLAEVRAILGSNVVELPRRNFVLFEDRFIPYPFENGIYRLPPETRARIGAGLIEAALGRARTPGWAPANFREWVYGFFGTAMGSEYLEPYNAKIWKRALDQLSADWVFTPGRVPTPEIGEISRAIAGVESVGYKEQAQFIYPKHGGIQSLYDAIRALSESAGAELRFDAPVRSLAREGTGWVVNGDVRATTILNTLPLPALIPIVRGTPDLRTWVDRFDYNRVLVVGVGIDGPDPGQTAVYVPRPDVPFHRYTWMSYLNPPGHGRSNLIAEVTIPKGQPFDAARLTQEVLEGLAHLKVLASPASALVVRAWMNEYGYPIYVKDHAATKRAVLEEFRRHDLFSVGRWGSWEYWNTDMVLRAVRTTVSEMLARPAASATGSERPRPGTP